MHFKVAARTILELGSELISSDAIALYELIKNAVDAGSDTGVAIDYVNTLSRRGYLELLEQFEDPSDEDWAGWPRKVIDSLEPDADPKNLGIIQNHLDAAESWDEIRKVIEFAYSQLSYIEVRDTGCGMSLSDLQGAFLTIGTPSRAAQIDRALEDDEVGDPPSLGEKGVGRLSAMRLGDVLCVKTGTEDGQFWNKLDIDWRDFAADLDAMLEDVSVEPARSVRKSDPTEHGTTLRISRLSANWTAKKLSDLANQQLARLADPFEARKKRRFGINLTYNGEKIQFTRFVRKVLLSECHALVKGVYVANGKAGPRLTLSISAPLYERGSQTETFHEIDLVSISSKRLGDIPVSALRTLGDFRFDLYWFNRQRLKKPENFETLKAFRELLRQWSGIMLYRDGYQVMPYGDEDTDWLQLDRDALGAKGYKLNKSQFVGRVSIGRLGNPHLVDQTNREGLRDCDEKDALIKLLRFAIQNRLNDFLEESVRALKQPEEREKDNPRLRKKEVTELKKRAGEKIKKVVPKHSEDRLLLKEVFEMFGELESRYRAAEKRIEAAEDERERLVDLAGLGLIIESLAHELTRTVEHAASILNKQDTEGLPAEFPSFFKTLRASMVAIEKRLKILDPLSVSGRQRRKILNLRRIIEEVFESHSEQFKRHNIRLSLIPKSSAPVSVFAIEGRIIQILENLISNSVYWLKAQRELTPSHDSVIEIEVVDESNPGFRFSDSGPGIPIERQERIFEAFYSTKAETTRQGLGLYIARESAEFHKGSMYLDESELNDAGNLTTFVVEIPDTRKQK